MNKKTLSMLLGAMALAMCLSADVQAGGKIYAPSQDHIHYAEDGMLEVYNMGMDNNDQCVISSYGVPTGKLQVISSAGHTVDLTIPASSGSHPGDAIQDAAGNYVFGGNDLTIQRFQSDGTFINSFPTGGYPAAVAEDDSGNLWVAEHNGFPVCQLVQYDTAGNVLQALTSAAGMPHRATIDFVGGMHMYDGLMYVADGGRMLKFDPADPAGTLTEAIAAMDYWGGNFWEVGGMDIGPDGRIYLVENVNDSVKIYDATLPANANYIQTITDPLLDETPSGVGVDAAGTVYVGENGAWPNVMKFEVPEPTSMILLGLGSLALLRRRRS